MRLEVTHDRIEVDGAAERIRALVEDGEAVATGREEVVHLHAVGLPIDDRGPVQRDRAVDDLVSGGPGRVPTSYLKP